jgi:hypothetical protein
MAIYYKLYCGRCGGQVRSDPRSKGYVHVDQDVRHKPSGILSEADGMLVSGPKVGDLIDFNPWGDERERTGKIKQICPTAGRPTWSIRIAWRGGEYGMEVPR